MSELLELEKIDEKNFKFKNSIVVIGFFDGVHLGHKKIISSCIDRAKQLNCSSMVLTFNRPPVNVVRNGAFKKLIIPYEEKIKIIESMDVDCIIVADINPDFLRLTPGQFCRDILLNKLHISEIFVGEGFHFGYQAAGDVSFLKNFFKPHNIKVNVISLLKVESEVVSSTVIRKYYSEGRVKEVSDLLGRNPQIEGIVTSGAGRGKWLGFPTANINICEFYIIPADGVYLGTVSINGEEEKVYPAVVNVGNNPTFRESEKRIEAYLLNFGGSLYNKKIKITFLEKLRNEIVFNSEDELVDHIKLDIKCASEYFNIEINKDKI